MVWIHGGNFVFSGSDGGGEKESNGTLLVQERVVVVKFNYQWNAFGFLAHPELDKERYYSGNFGLQDQLTALAWVKQKNAAHGGHPGRVTAFG